MMQKDGLDEIIEQKISRREILQVYQAGKINMPEQMLLFSLDNEGFFRRILKGWGEYHLPYDSTVPRDAYFTNVPMLMNAFYSLYAKYPLYHFDRLFEFGMNRLCSSRFDLFEVLYYLHYHLKREMDGTAAFVISAAPILQKASAYMCTEDQRNMLSLNKRYDASAYEDGLLGLCRHYREVFIRAADVDILPDE